MIANISGGMYLSDIADITGGRLHGKDKLITALSTDSRQIADDCMFIAIKGERFDGHDFVRKCADDGMAAFMCEYVPQGCEDQSIVVVDDVISALGVLAGAHKSRYNVLTVAVTGSVGKTTTKEFIYSVLSSKYNTVKTEGNHNNFIGLPMTLFSINESTEAAVIEMGMSSRGEIEYLSKIVRPDIAVITNIGTSHIENLGSREEIAKAKLEIRQGLLPEGRLLVNGDERLLSFEDDVIRVGVGEDCDFRIDNIAEGENGSAFDLSYKDDIFESVLIPTFGEHNVMNAAFAFAVGKYANMGEYEIRRGLLAYQTTGMRQNLCTKRGRVIIEDCYNASPESMIASLKVLSELAKRRGKRAVAVLGNMLELGFYAEEGHTRAGTAAASTVDLLLTFGKDASYIARGAVTAGLDSSAVHTFEDIDDVEAIGNYIINNTDDNDVILFKASRGVKLERVIAYFEAN